MDEIKKPNILIVNDDGIEAAGIYSLWKALEGLGNRYIIAPADEQSGVGCKISFKSPLTIKKFRWEDDTPAWKINGTPADCVRLAISKILPFVPDLIVSGINRGGNPGRVVLYSGTVGGIIEGALRGIPGIAFSCYDYLNPDYAKTIPYIRSIIEHSLQNPLPKGSLLNVNFPDTATIEGVRMATQGLGYWIENPEERTHPEVGNYIWLGGEWLDHEEHEESDVALLKKGFVTAVPIQVQDFTAHNLFKERKTLFETHFENLTV